MSLKEQDHPDSKMNRNAFIRFAPIALSAAVLGGAEALRRAERHASLDWLRNPDGFIFHSLGPLLTEPIRGTQVNSPFLYKQPNYVQEHYVTRLPQIIGGMRMFGDDDSEPTLGDINGNVLKRIARLGRKLNRVGKTFQLDLINGYTMFPGWSPVYGGHDATSPYTADGSDDFYIKTKYYDAYLLRAAAYADALRHNGNLAAVSVGNELQGNPTLMTNWYKKVVPEIRTMFPNAVIMTGLADPRMLTEHIQGTVDTAHFYPATLSANSVIDFIQAHETVFQEFGSPFQIGGVSLPEYADFILADYLEEVLYQTAFRSAKNNVIILGTTSLYLWKYDTYHDGFQWDPDNFPLTNEILTNFYRIMQKIRPKLTAQPT